MSRTSLTIGDGAYERLAAHKREDESWTDFADRVADLLEDTDDTTEHTSNTVAVENVDEIARAAADEVENRMTRR